MTFRAIVKNLTKTVSLKSESNRNMMIQLNSLSSSSDEDVVDDDEEVELLANDECKLKEVVETNGESNNEIPATTYNRNNRKRSSCGVKCIWCFLFCVAVLGVGYILKRSLARNAKHPGDGNIKVVEEDDIDQAVPPQKTSLNIFDKIITKKTKLESCSDFDVKMLWYKKFDKFKTESAIRILDLNDDGVDDLVSGFVTTLETKSDMKDDERRAICMKYYNGINPCQGGVFALDGISGDRLWLHYTQHEIYSINCNADINQDGVADCLVGGRAGLFQALNGKNGNLLWDDKGNSETEVTFHPSWLFLWKFFFRF